MSTIPRAHKPTTGWSFRQGSNVDIDVNTLAVNDFVFVDIDDNAATILKHSVIRHTCLYIHILLHMV